MVTLARARTVRRRGASASAVAVPPANAAAHADLDLPMAPADAVVIGVEVVDRATVLGELGRVLCPAGWLSITEQAGDPDHLPLTALEAQVEQAGFDLSGTYRGRLSYTANFRKRAAES